MHFPQLKQGEAIERVTEDRTKHLQRRVRLYQKMVYSGPNQNEEGHTKWFVDDEKKEETSQETSFFLQ